MADTVPNPFYTGPEEEPQSVPQATPVAQTPDQYSPITAAMFGVPAPAGGQETESLYNISTPVTANPGAYNIRDVEPSNGINFPVDSALGRAQRFDFALGDKSPGKDTILSDVMNGKEEDTRLRAVTNENVMMDGVRKQLVEDYAKGNFEVTPDSADMMMKILTTPLKEINPKTILERKFAQRVIQGTIALDNNTSYATAISTGNQQDYITALNLSEITVAKQQIARNIYDEIDTKAKGQSWFGSRGVDNLEQFAAMGFLNWIALGSGSSKRDHIADLYLKSPEDFEKAVREDLGKLDYNVGLQQTYIKELMGYTATDAFLENAGIVGNVLLLGGAAAGTFAIKKALQGTVAGVSNLKSMVGSVAKATAQSTINPTAVLDAGSPFLAAKTIALKEMAPDKAMELLGSTTGVGNQVRDVTNRLFDVSNPNAVLAGSKSLSSAVESQRFIDTIFNKTNDILKSVFINPLTINRFTEAEIDAQFTMARSQFRNEFPSLNNSVLRVTHIPAENTIAKTDTYAIDIGKTSGTFFDTQAEAFAFAEANGINGRITKDIKGAYRGGSAPMTEAMVVANDGKYAIRVFKTMDETQASVRNKLALGKGSDDIKGGLQDSLPFLRGLQRFIRTPKDQLPQGISKYTDVAALSQNGIEKASKQLWNAIDALPGTSKLPFASYRQPPKGTSRADFVDYLKIQRDFVDKNGVRGRFDNTVSEFEANWQAHHNRLPSADESMAYFAYRRLSDIDYMGYNLGIYRDKLRLGLSTYKLPFESSAGKGMTSGLEGKIIPELPRNSKQGAGVLIYDKDPANVKRVNLRYATDKQRDQWAKDGYKVMHVDRDNAWNALQDTPNLRHKDVYPGPAGGVVPGKHLMETVNGKFDYILVKDYQQSALPFQQLPYRPGGHVRLQPKWMVSQPNIGENSLGLSGGVENVHYGDRNIMTASWKQDAKGYAENLEKARTIYNGWKSGAITEASAKSQVEKFMPLGVEGKLPQSIAYRFETKTKPLPVTWEDFKGHFEGKDAFLDPKLPIVHRPLNQSSLNYPDAGLHAMTNNRGVTRFPNLRSASEGEHSLYGSQVNMQYATERGDHIPGIKDLGTKYKPAYNVVPTDHIDPLLSLRQSYAGVTRNRVIDDLKFKMAENYVQAFKSVLDAPLEQLRADPFRALVNARFKQASVGDSDLVNTAKAYQKAATEFLNIKSDRQTAVDHAKSVVQDRLYRTLGEPAANLVERIMPWSRIDEPFQQLKALTFDNAMFLNPAQILMQGLASTHTMAVLGIPKGLNAMSGGMWLKMVGRGASEATVDSFAGKAGAMGYKHLKEAYYALERTNWSIVGRETTDLNNYMHTSLSDGYAGQARDFGRSFFKVGESYSRLSAWAGAFEEWRAANPTKLLTDRAIADILYRADTLSVNMMSSSAASWQKGALSIPTQFMAWNIRLAEQMLPGWSTRLTLGEKLHAFAVYSGLFGVPVALSGLTGVYPWHTMINKAAQQYYGSATNPLNDTVVAEALNHGLAQTMIHHMTGGDYNLSQKFGTNGISLFHNLIEGDKSTLMTLIGPTGQMLSNYWKAVAPFERYATGVFENSDDRFPLTRGDFEQFFRNTTGLSNFAKAWTAYNTGAYISNHGVKIEGGDENGFDKADAIVLGLTGAVPQRVQETMDMSEGNHDLRQLQKDSKQEIIERIRASWKSGSEGNWDESTAYLKQAKILFIAGGYHDVDATHILNEASKGFESMADRVREDFMKLNPKAIDRIIDGKN